MSNRLSNDDEWVREKTRERERERVAEVERDK